MNIEDSSVAGPCWTGGDIWQKTLFI